MMDRTLRGVLLGLCASIMPGSLAQAQTALPVAPPAEAVDGKGVDILSGSLILKDPGVSIGSADSGGLDFNRSWGGFDAATFGGWNNSYNYNLSYPVPYNPIVVTIGNRSQLFMPTITPGVGIGPPYNPVLADGTSLTNNGGSWLFTDRDGTTIVFSLPGGIYKSLAASVTRPNGERITFSYGSWLYYGTPGGTAVPVYFLKSVQTNFGYQIKLEYPASSSAASSAMAINDAVEYCDPSALTCSGMVNQWPKVTYARPAGCLPAHYTETTTDPTGKTRSFGIDASIEGDNCGYARRIASYTPGPTGTSSTNYTYSGGFGGNPVVSVVSDLSGSWSYKYDNSSVWTATRTAPNLSTNIIKTKSAYSPLLPSVIASRQDELARVTNYLYDSNLRLIDRIPPEGTMSGGNAQAGYTHNQYDSRGNVTSVTMVPKTGSTLVSIVYSAGYDAACSSPAKCNKPNWVRDALGNETVYTYDSDHGGILSELRPAPSTGAARPLTLTTWVQIYGWVKNASGAMIQSAYPVWRVATQTVCQTIIGSNAPTCDVNAPQTVTTYQYGASGTRDALLIKGVAVSSGGQTLRTCYDYDIYSRKISETKPNAGLTVCP